MPPLSMLITPLYGSYTNHSVDPGSILEPISPHPISISISSGIEEELIPQLPSMRKEVQDNEALIQKFMPTVPRYLERCMPDAAYTPFAASSFADSRLGCLPIEGSPIHYWGDGYFSVDEYRIVSIKSWRVTRMYSTDHDEFMMRYGQQISWWTTYSHRNIVPCLGVVAGIRCIPDIVLPLYDNGNVLSYLKKHPDADILSLLRGMASGLSYIHHLNPPRAHGNLKGTNVLVDDDDQACLTDFGTEHISNKIHITSPHVCEPCRWMAPEIIKPPPDEADCSKDMTSPASDIYSFAMTALQMFTGKKPFAHRPRDTVVILDIIEGRRPHRPSFQEAPQLTDTMWELLIVCWDEDPAKRPTIDQVAAFINMEILFKGDSDSDCKQ